LIFELEVLANTGLMPLPNC